MNKMRIIFVLILVLVLGAGGGYYYYWQKNQDTLPAYIASGNGRIETREIHISTKYSGRVDQVLVDEGDMVKAGQIVAQMDTAELNASKAKARAEVASAQQSVDEAKAEIVQRQSQLDLAIQQLKRATRLVKNNNISREEVDQRTSDRDVAQAALTAANSRLISAQRNVEAAQAELDQVQVQIDDSTLKAPKDGRIQYRLAEPGEVLAGGGAVLSMLDLSDVYMTIFLPTKQAGGAYVGNDARIILDAAPQFVIPAHVSFVADDAQFTPREVETKTERSKLMFRVKVQIDKALLAKHIRKVKTGLPGEAYVILGDNKDWPKEFTPNIPAADPGQTPNGDAAPQTPQN